MYRRAFPKNFISRARIKRMIAKQVASTERDIRLTQDLTTLIEASTTLKAGTSLTLEELSIKSPADPYADPDIQLIIEPTATLIIAC